MYRQQNRKSSKTLSPPTAFINTQLTAHEQSPCSSHLHPLPAKAHKGKKGLSLPGHLCFSDLHTFLRLKYINWTFLISHPIAGLILTQSTTSISSQKLT